MTQNSLSKAYLSNPKLNESFQSAVSAADVYKRQNMGNAIIDQGFIRYELWVLEHSVLISNMLQLIVCCKQAVRHLTS